MEEITEKQIQYKLRKSIKGLFSDHPEVRAEAVEALKIAWEYDQPCFNLGELAAHTPEAAALSAMRRSTIKEFIDWIEKI